MYSHVNGREIQWLTLQIGRTASEAVTALYQQSGQWLQATFVYDFQSPNCTILVSSAMYIRTYVHTYRAQSTEWHETDMIPDRKNRATTSETVMALYQQSGQWPSYVHLFHCFQSPNLHIPSLKCYVHTYIHTYRAQSGMRLNLAIWLCAAVITRLSFHIHM